MLLARQKKCWELKQSTLKGGEGRGSGNGLNSRYGGHWKLEKVFLMKVSQQFCNLLSELVVTVLAYGHFVYWNGKASIVLRLIWCFQKKKGFNSLICCEWKMASDKLDFGGVSV